MPRRLLFAATVCSLLGICLGNANAETILKLGLGADIPPDIEFDGTTLTTVDQGDPSTDGDQNTGVEFLAFLTGVHADIPPALASFTMDSLITDGPAEVLAGTLVVQNFTGGIMELYDVAPDNDLLLSATLDASVLTGPLGAPATGAVFTVTFGTVTGGSLAPYIEPNTLTMAMSLTNVNGGSGFSVTDPDGPEPSLDPFEADVTLNIAALQVPEPGSAALLVLGTALAVLFAARRRR